MEKKYYIAYGSNLSAEQMKARTLDARIVGTAILYGWQLLFKVHATIEPNEEKNTPVLVWEISERDERNLDRYEGYPSYYYKKDLPVEVFPLDGGEPQQLTAMVYIMADGHRLAEPASFYYKVLEDGYRAFHFPVHILEQALADSVGRDKAIELLGECTLTKMRKPAQEETDAALGQTVDEFLKNHPHSRVSLFTPGGYVDLDADGIGRLISGYPVEAHAGSSDTRRKADAKEILPQRILKVSKENGVWYCMTECTDGEE